MPSILPALLNQERVLITRKALSVPDQAPGSMMRLPLIVRGDLDINHVRLIIKWILNRHSALTVSFAEDLRLSPPQRERLLARFRRTQVIGAAGLHTQTATPVEEPALGYLDLSSGGEDQKKSTLLQLVSTEGMRAFSLQETPRVRVHLLKMAQREHLLLLFIDHLVSDSGSLVLLATELKRLLCRPDPVPSTSGKNSYFEFAAWQYQAFQTAFFDADVSYWRGQWARFAAARIDFADLPFRTSKSPKLGFAREIQDLTASDTKMIRSRSRELEISPFVLFLASLAVVLRNYTGKAKVAVWGNFMNRVRPEAVGAVGWFSNYHLLGIDLESITTVTDLLLHVQEVLGEAIQHQQLPLPHLWRALSCVPRYSDAMVLLDFRSAADMERSAERDGRLEVTDGNTLPGPLGPRASSLGFYVVDHGERIEVSCEYLADHFAAEGVVAMLGSFWEAIKMIARNDDAYFLAAHNVPDRYKRFYPEDSGHLGEFLVLQSDLIPTDKPTPLGTS